MSSAQVDTSSLVQVANSNNAANSDDLLLCYNRSCGLNFREQENGDEACVFHSGEPYFHDGYKEWTCCRMKSRDFNIFLNFKGCTKGRHSNVRPEEPPKAEVLEEVEEEKVQPTPEPVAVEVVPPYTPPDANLVETIPIVEAPSVATAPPVKNIVICKHCKGEESTLDLNAECLYHRGIQVFHDSLKFWSCCPHKKFTEFEDFQKLPPCARADTHQLMVKVDYKENWFQTGGTLTIALYGLRGARFVEGKSLVTLTGGRKLFARLVNAKGITIFENEWPLYDYVQTDRCKCTLNTANAQIVLQKVNPRVHWPALVEKKPAATAAAESL